MVPVLGNMFDVNNLGLISGMSFIILLIVLRLTLRREKNNLKIALKSISERYTDNMIGGDYENFMPFILYSKDGMEMMNNEAARKINYTRRKHHYNFLSMNEVFNLPSLDVADNELQNTTLGRIISRHLFYFPYLIYLVIYINDLLTWKRDLIILFGIQYLHTYAALFLFLHILFMQGMQ